MSKFTFQDEFASMFNEGNTPPPVSKQFLDELEDIQLVNDEGMHVKTY